jgi:hypothetical protein
MNYIGKHVYIKSISYNRHIGCSDKSMAYSFLNRSTWEKFLLSGDSNNLMIRSHNNQYLATNSSGAVYFTNSVKSSTTKWKLIDWYGHIVIKSNYNNRYLHFSEKAPETEFYQHCNYGGWVKRLKPGNYANLSTVGIRNDDMSSMKVPFGINVTLYEHGNFGGKSWTVGQNTNLDCFTSKTMSTKKTGWRWHSRTVKINWNDKVSSIKIIRTGDTFAVDTLSKPDDKCIVDFSEPNEFALSWSSSGIPTGMVGLKCNIPMKKAETKTKISDKLDIKVLRSKGQANWPSTKKSGMWVEINNYVKSIGGRLPTAVEIKNNRQLNSSIGSRDIWVPAGTPANKDWIQLGNTGRNGWNYGQSHTKFHGYPSWDTNGKISDLIVIVNTNKINIKVLKSKGAVNWPSTKKSGTYSWVEINNYVNSIGARLPTVFEIRNNRQLNTGIGSRDLWVPVGTPANKDWVQIGNVGRNGWNYGQSHTESHGYPVWDTNGQYFTGRASDTIVIVNNIKLLRSHGKANWPSKKKSGTYSWVEINNYVNSIGARLPTAVEIRNNKQLNAGIGNRDLWVPVGTPKNKDWVQLGNVGRNGWNYGQSHTQFHRYPTWDTNGKYFRGRASDAIVIVDNNNWSNNYLCSNTELPWKWVTTQSGVDKWTKQGYKFVRWVELADPIFVQNPIGLCIPKRSNIELKFTSWNNINVMKKDGFNVTRILEEKEPAETTWTDNWLGYKKITPVFDKINIGYRLEAWSGGWANKSCRNKTRGGKYKVYVNGSSVGSGSRGLCMIVTNENGKKTFQGNYDTHAHTSASDSFVNNFNRLSSNVNDDSIIIIGSQDDASTRITTKLKDIMADKGASMFSQLGFRGSYLFIFRPRDGAVVYEGLNNCGDVHYVYDCGVLCKNIYSKSYYQSKNPDAKDPDNHWVKIGIKEGRQGHPNFDAKDYKMLYEDISPMNNEQAARHYVTHGSSEGRIGTMFNPTYGFGGLLTNHLMCFLDAGNNKSYSGKGKIWNDLSGNNNNFEFQTEPLTDGLSLLDLNKHGKEGKLPDIKSFKISPRGGYTVIMVARQKDLTKNSALESVGSNTFYVHWVWEDGRTYFGNNGCCEPNTTRNSYEIGKDSWNNEMMIAYVFTTSGGLDIYINGKRVVRGIRGKAKSFEATGPLYINKGNNWKADMKMLMVYNYGMPKTYIKNIWKWYDQTNKSRIISRLDNGEIQTKKNLPYFPVPRGVQVYLSANNINSYKKESLTVNDLSGNNRNFVFDKKPKLVDGKWIINGYNTLRGPASSSLGIEGDSDYCIIARVKTNTLNANALFNVYGNHIADRGIFFHPSWVNKIAYFDQGSGVGSSNIKNKKPYVRLFHGIPEKWNELTTFALSRTSKGRQLYINGIKTTSNAERGGSINFTADRIELFATKHHKIWDGEMSDFIIYNRGLSSSEIRKITKYIDNPYSVKNSTWNEASQYCLRQGKQLCQQDELCFGGKAIDPSSRPNSLAPIGDKPGSWINLTTCKVIDNSGTVNNAHIKCCPLPKRAPHFETCYYLDGWIHFFKDTMILKYNVDSHVSEGPIDLNHEYPGLPQPFKSGNIDSVYVLASKLYLIKDKLAVVYNIKTHKLIKGPGSMTQIFPGLRGTFKKGYIDAMCQHPNDINVIYFIKGSKFCSYNVTNNTSTTIKKLNSKNGGWSGLAGFFSTKINAVVTFKKSNTGFMFFKEDQYFDYSTQKIGSIIPTWHGFVRPFVTDGQYCSILKKRIDHFRKKSEEFRNSNPELYRINNDILKEANMNQSKYCEQVSVQSYVDRLTKEKQRQVKLLANIKNLQFKQGQTLNQSKQLVEEKNRLVSVIDDLKIKIAIEEKKKCPVNSVCKPKPKTTIKINKKNKNAQCTSGMMTNLMKKQGYTSDQIDQLNAAINYVPSINDYDIRTHKKFYQYVDKGGVKVCPDRNNMSLSSRMKQDKIKKSKLKNLSPNELLETLYSSQKYKNSLSQLNMLDHAQRKREIKQLVKQHEDIAVKLLRDAVLKYHMDHVADKLPDFIETVRGAKSLTEFSKVTDNIVSNMKIGKGVAMHLALLKEIQNILRDIDLHPKYQSLTADIKKITNDIKLDSKLLNKTTISSEVAAIQEKINKSHKLLLKKTGKLERFISSLKVSK